MATREFDEAAIFNAARQIDSVDDRRRYLQEACGDDHALRKRVEALLRAHRQKHTLLDPVTVEIRAVIEAAIAGDGPGTRVGPYRLLEPIGEGGMGTVFRAEQTEPIHRPVAVKIIKPGMDSGLILARFERERQALAIMDHPNIARVLDAGTTQTNRPYFVMELIDGVPITRFCDEHRLTLRGRLELFIPVCQAVQHAHQKGIIHRDIKPTNVLVGTYDGRPVPKVIDFGIAKAIDVKLSDRTLSTAPNSVIGTPEYMSPEQAEPDQLDIDTRSDVYSLGVLLYELLTGTTPLGPARRSGAGLLDLLRRLREEEPPRPSTRVDTTAELPTVAANRGVEPRKLSGLVRGDLDWIVMKCLEKDRTRRYATANALARDVERYLNVEPVEACPPSRRYRLRKFARKNRNLLAAAGAFVLLLAAGAAVSTWLAVRATAAERLANEERAQAVAEKDRADEEKGRADEQAAVAEAVNNFLNQDLLIQVSPEHAPERDLKLRTVLDRASQKLEGRFPNQPLVEAKLHTTLSAAYQSLGELARAEHHARRAYELYLDKLGPEGRHTVGAMNNLATALFDQRKHVEARDLYEKTIPLERKVFGPEDKITLASMSNLAGTYATLGQLEEARKLLEETLTIQKNVLGQGNRYTLTTMSNLAAVYKGLKQPDKALKLYQETVELQGKHLKPGDPQAITTKLNYAELLVVQGEYPEGLRLRRATWEAAQQALDPDHPVRMNALKAFAASLWLTEHYEESLQRFEELLKVQRAQNPPSKGLDDTLRILAWYTAIAPDPKARNPKRAIELAKEFKDHAPEKGGRWHTLGVVCYRGGEYEQAITALEKAEELDAGKQLGYTAPFLAMAHWKLGDREKARQWYDRGAAWLQKNATTDPEPRQWLDEAARLMGIPTSPAPAGKNGK
jgi:serine/threonine protein kinase/Flp pilus assembly protein TadD